MSKYYSLLSIATLPLATLLLGSGCTLINPGTASIVEAGSEEIEGEWALAEITVADATNEFNFGLDESTLANLTPASRELMKELRNTPDMHPLVRQQTLAVIRSQARNAQRAANGSAASSAGQTPTSTDYYAGLNNNQLGDNQHSDNQHSDNQYGDNQYGDNQYGDNQYGDNQYGDNQHSDNQHSDNQLGALVNMSAAMLKQMGRAANDSQLRQRRPTDTYISPDSNNSSPNNPSSNNPSSNNISTGNHSLGDDSQRKPLPPIPDRTFAATAAGFNASISDSSSATTNSVEWTENSVEWTEYLAKTRATLSKSLQETPRLTKDERGRMQAILRVLDLLEGRKESALEPVVEYDEDLRQYLSHQLQSLSVMLDPAGIPIPERRSAVALRSLRTAERFLSNRSQLDLQNVSFCEAVNGFGDINEFTANTFTPDQRTLLYVEIRNMTEIDNGSGFETELQGSYEIFDATGRRVANRTLPLERGRCSNFRRDYYIAYLIYIPQRIQAGEHTLQLTIEDLQGKKFGQATVEFNIRQ